MRVSWPRQLARYDRKDVTGRRDCGIVGAERLNGQDARTYWFTAWAEEAASHRHARPFHGLALVTLGSIERMANIPLFLGQGVNVRLTGPSSGALPIPLSCVLQSHLRVWPSTKEHGALTVITSRELELKRCLPVTVSATSPASAPACRRRRLRVIQMGPGRQRKSSNLHLPPPAVVLCAL
jgi:hypothetical protein